MQPFQNYSMNNYPHYQQQMYQPMQNPYMDSRFANLQPTQMSGASQFTTLGKIVESVDIVKATDIPMDGNMYYFPKADGTEIYGKQWLSNGQTRISTFKPLLDVEVDNSSNEDEKSKFDAFNEVLKGIQNDIKLLNDKMDRVSKSTTSSKVKKEGNSDE